MHGAAAWNRNDDCLVSCASIVSKPTSTVPRRSKEKCQNLHRDCRDGLTPNRTVAIYRQAVPIQRVAMTYLETEEMNHPFREAGAILLSDPTNQAF